MRARADTDDTSADATRQTIAEPRPAGARVKPRSSVDLPFGTHVDGYTLEDVIGAGGFGAVYRARDATGRRVAIKVLHAAHGTLPGAVERFLREIAAVRAIRHDNLAQVLGCGRLPDLRPYMVMEYLEGEDLDARLRRARLTPFEALELLEPLCDALAAAHACGIVHRDVKPSNVFVLADDPRRVLLLDFGVAKMHDESGASLTRTGQRLGTPNCMAPEQIAGGPVDARTDVYALGVLLHVLLTGRSPFHAETPTQMLFLQRCAMPPRPSEHAPVPSSVDRLVASALDPDPARRPAGAREFAAGLRRALIPAVPRSRAGRALAVHVEAWIAPAVLDDCASADDLIDDVDAVLARAAAHLGPLGFQIGLETSSAAVLVRVLHNRDEAAAYAEASAALFELEVELGRRPHARPEVSISLALAAGEVELTDDGAISGGPLLDLAGWTAERR
jgi:eukaryotic-like serine/threonine-protein kinase